MEMTPSQKIEELRQLGPNWDGRRSAPPSHDALNTAAQVALHPSVVPLGNGGIQIEWHLGGFDLEVEIGPNGRVRGVAWNVA